MKKSKIAKTLPRKWANEIYKLKASKEYNVYLFIYSLEDLEITEFTCSFSHSFNQQKCHFLERENKVNLGIRYKKHKNIMPQKS